MIKRFVWYISIFLMVCIIVFAVQFTHFLIFPAKSNTAFTVIEIPQGISFSSISKLLIKKRIVRDYVNFKLLGYLMGATHKTKYGEYLLSSSMRPTTIIDKLLNGEVMLHEVTIPEGYTDEEIAQTLHQRGLLKNVNDFIKLTHDPVFIASVGVHAPSLEGFLFPNTYDLSKGLSSKDILIKMVDQFKAEYTSAMQQRAKQLGMTELQIITLASMIEKETSNPQERYLISAVFYNRLKRHMRLQSDPTVIYGLHLKNSRITLHDLREKNKYNTYTISGLPPGPICNPGKDSIIAALYPAHVDYLYFVSKNNGTHMFTRTLKSHNYYVNLYQRKK